MFGKYGTEHGRRSTRDERRNAACEPLREVRAGDGQARKSVARETACSASRSVRGRILLREPERAGDLVFTDRARLRRAVRDRGVSALRKPVLRAGRSVVEGGSEQAVARSRQDGASCRVERGRRFRSRGDRSADGGSVEAREAASRCEGEGLGDHESGGTEAARGRATKAARAVSTHRTAKARR